MASERTYDRQLNFKGGMNSFDYAADLPPNQVQLMQNFIVLDNGRAITRPGADWLDSNPTSKTNINPIGPVQGMAFLDNAAHGQLLLTAEGGKLYTWNGATWSNALAFALTSANSIFTAVQGVDQLLMTDGVQHMRLWDGVTFTDCGAAANTNAPVGATILAYIAGMFVAAGPAMVAGAGPTTYPADTLFFSNYLAAGVGNWNITQSFRVGNGDGEAIVAMTPVQATASTVPVYNLAVLKENSVWIVNINPGAYYSATNNTSALAYAAMFAALSVTAQGDQIGTGIGCVGKDAWCLYQNDVLFFSQDGVQSLQRMQAAAGQYQLTAPLSQPIQPYIDRINWNYAKFIKAIKYRRWAIFFVPLDTSTTNNYALVWDGRLGQWFIWTGWNPTAVCVTRFPSGTVFSGGETQAGIQLVIGNNDGSVCVLKDSQALIGEDSTYLDNGSNIVQLLDTRSFIFGGIDWQKKLRAALVRFNRGNATVNFTAYCDSADSDDWSQPVNPGGVTLPVILPFVLASQKPTQAYRQLEGLQYCSEMYLRLEINEGWVDIRNVSVVAFLKALRNPNA